MNRLDELERLEKAATPGPFDVRFRPAAHIVRVFEDSEGRRCTAFVATYESATLPNVDNAAFGVAIRNSAPALLAVARAAETLMALMDFAEKTCGGKEELRAALDKLTRG